LRKKRLDEALMMQPTTVAELYSAGGVGSDLHQAVLAEDYAVIATVVRNNFLSSFANIHEPPEES
jgi:hypothetical protein